jgi:ABC-type nitrate/sulfonate/bicarbonate transport system substrate-binding protein
MSQKSRRAAGLLVSLATVSALALSSCSAPTPTSVDSSASDSEFRLDEPTTVRLLLDYFVYGGHAGIYQAIEAGYYADNNIELEVIVPNDPVASMKFVQAGQADIGVASPVDVVFADTTDSEYDAVMSLIGGNLEGMAVSASSGIDSFDDLEGKIVGTSGSVSHLALAGEMIRGAGGDPDKVEFLTVGSGFMQYLVDGQVDAVVSFKPDVAAAEAAGEDVSFLALGSGGEGLAFPSIVAYANEDYIAENPDVLAAFIDATTRGYEDLLEDPEAAAQATVDANAGLELEGMLSQVEGIGQTFVGPYSQYGAISPAAIQALIDFMVENGFIESDIISADDIVSNEFVPSE